MEFLTSITPKKALEILASFPVAGMGTAHIGIEDALQRVLAEEIIAREEIPAFDRSLVDGFALKVKDTYGAKETTPAFLYVKGEVRVAEEPKGPVGNGEAIYVATGAIVPPGADGVVMEEHVRRVPDAVEVTRSLRKGENIIFRGEDVEKGSLVLRRGIRLSPFDLGVLAALGVTKVSAFRMPQIGLISSGDEIVGVDTTPPPGRVRDINRYTVSNLLKKEGCSVRFVGIAKDAIEDVVAKLEAARDADVILVSGGSSKGAADFITTAIEQQGGEILFHGINIRPGKPTIFGRLWEKPVFGLPGHPVSCSMVVLRFVLPLLRRLTGESDDRRRTFRGTLETNVPSSYGVEEYVRVTVTGAGHDLFVSPIFAKSSVISMLSKADGYIIVPEGREGFEKGEQVEVYPLG